MWSKIVDCSLKHGYCLFVLGPQYLLNMVSQDVSSSIEQRGLPSHNDGVLPGVYNPGCGGSRRH